MHAPPPDHAPLTSLRCPQVTKYRMLSSKLLQARAVMLSAPSGPAAVDQLAAEMLPLQARLLRWVKEGRGGQEEGKGDDRVGPEGGGGPQLRSWRRWLAGL